jgi:acyl-CoA thioesterase
LAREIEQGYGAPDFQFTRLTVDLFRPPPLRPVTVSTRPLREGNRIRVVEGSVASDGVEVARASAVMLRRAEQPAGQVWTPPDWDMPPPEAAGRAAPFGPPPGDGRSTAERRRTWFRDEGQLVAGEEMSPFVRVALAADLTNPFANSGTNGLNFINADITLYLHRLPVSEWIGFEVASHRSADGIAVGACTLYDIDGAIGQTVVCSVANRRLEPDR